MSHDPTDLRNRFLRMLLPLLFALSSEPAVAQVVNDGSLGTNGPGLVTNIEGVDGTDFFLTEADGELVGGTSLFHSLLQLDLGKGDSLTYQGASTIENLITRIHGSQSDIDGVIRSEIPGANLYLVNPHGVILRENARLDVSGDVVISTAHELGLGESGRFDAFAAGGDVLTVDPPETFGFMAPPAPIVIAGSEIDGEIGRSLALIGGDLTLDGTRVEGGLARVNSPSGRLALVGVGSAGEVEFPADGESRPVLTGFSARGSLSISDDFLISSSGVNLDPYTPLRSFGFVGPSPGSGPIWIVGHDLLLQDSEIRALTVTPDSAGDVSIDLSGDLSLRTTPGNLPASIAADSDLTISPPSDFPSDEIEHRIVGTFLYIDFSLCDNRPCGVEYRGGGDAGDITIKAHDVFVEGGSQIGSDTQGAGDAGSILLDLSGDLTITGVSSTDSRSGLFSGSEGTGSPGTIEVRAINGRVRMDDLARIVIENGPQSSVQSTPGMITITAGGLDMAGEARIDSSTRGEGDGGAIVINLTGDAQLVGTGSLGDPDDLEAFTGISSLAQSGSSGNAGTIALSASSLTMTEGARIAARPTGSETLGDAGNIALSLVNDLVLNESNITTKSSAAGGNIDIAVARSMQLADSLIETSVTEGDEPGGNITVRPGPEVVVLERSDILANAFEGAGGNILIQTSALLVDPQSNIEATSVFGTDGVVTFESPDGEINIQQPELAVPPVDAADLLKEACASRDPTAASSFFVEADAGPRIRDDDILWASAADALGQDDPAPTFDETPLAYDCVR